MKFEKVAAYVAENDLDQEILEQAETKSSILVTSKRKKQMDKLLRLEDVKYQRILIMKNQIDVYRSKTKIKQDSSGNISQASRISGVSPSDVSVLLIYMGR
jgi:tRNA uridine 5-carboxymethylaminomethyl modification enzyme